MNYEKAYKDALERAKELLLPSIENAGILYNRRDFEYVFPELEDFRKEVKTKIRI